MALAARTGIQLDVMYNIVTNAAGNSSIFETGCVMWSMAITPRISRRYFSKDLGLVSDTAKALHFPLPLASTALNMFTSASNAGYGKEDDSAGTQDFLSHHSTGSEIVIKIGVIADDLPARRISPVFWWKTVYQRYKLTVFQQVKCGSNRRTGDQPENALLSGG
ncbi:NAD-binding protein [Shigella sonnei]